jgi:putative YhdH/YhfP family quinone oxidoreductase
MTDATFRAYTATQTDGPTERAIVELNLSDLPEDGVLIDVEYSSVNYKDGLATSASGKVARISPIIPGIDLAGTVIADGTDEFPVGTQVIAHGYDLGVSRFGGYAERARVPAEWLVKLPTGLTTRDAMAIGTAGFTAALSIVALEDWGIAPGDGAILVTGATGGVGSTAVNILGAKGYEVIASSGKPEATAYLKSLGASEVIDRAELSAEGKPLQPMVYAGAVDCVGGTTLANVLARVSYGGAVAASGLTGGTAVPTTVMPFILRAVSLLGIDSVQTPIAKRRAVWERLGGDLRPTSLSLIGKDLTLYELDDTLDAILRGEAIGRTVIDLRG